MKRIFLTAFCAFVLTFPADIAARSRKAPKSAPKSSFEQINLNEVEENDLKQIPGISASQAKTLLTYRDVQGKIKSVEDLKEITHETRSGKTNHTFATAKGNWSKSIQVLMDAEIFTVSGGVDFVDQDALYKHLFPEPRDINKASLEELTQLPGISKANAQRLIDNRPYTSIDGLKDISYETRSGKTSYSFATTKGAWKKNINILVDSGRLIGPDSQNESKKPPRRQKARDLESDDLLSDEPEEY